MPQKALGQQVMQLCLEAPCDRETSGRLQVSKSCSPISEGSCHKDRRLLVKDCGHQVPRSGLEGTGCRDGVCLGKAPGHRVPRSALEGTCRREASARPQITKSCCLASRSPATVTPWKSSGSAKNKCAVQGLLTAPLCPVLSRCVLRALWCGRVTASTCVSTCHKGPWATLPRSIPR